MTNLELKQLCRRRRFEILQRVRVSPTGTRTQMSYLQVRLYDTALVQVGQRAEMNAAKGKAADALSSCPRRHAGYRR